MKREIRRMEWRKAEDGTEGDSKLHGVSPA
jgi:hypothetical protein